MNQHEAVSLSVAQRERVLDWLNHALWLLAAVDAVATSAKLDSPELAPLFRSCATALAGVIERNVGDRDLAGIQWSVMRTAMLAWESDHGIALQRLRQSEPVEAHFQLGAAAALKSALAVEIEAVLNQGSEP